MTSTAGTREHGVRLRSIRGGGARRRLIAEGVPDAALRAVVWERDASGVWIKWCLFAACDRLAKRTPRRGYDAMCGAHQLRVTHWRQGRRPKRPHVRPWEAILGLDPLD